MHPTLRHGPGSRAAGRNKGRRNKEVKNRKKAREGRRQALRLDYEERGVGSKGAKHRKNGVGTGRKNEMKKHAVKNAGGRTEIRGRKC